LLPRVIFALTLSHSAGFVRFAVALMSDLMVSLVRKRAAWAGVAGAHAKMRGAFASGKPAVL
jgi:hypothetical protein